MNLNENINWNHVSEASKKIIQKYDNGKQKIETYARREKRQIKTKYDEKLNDVWEIKKNI